MAALLLNFRNTIILSLVLAAIMIVAFGTVSNGRFDMIFWQAVFRWMHVVFGILWIGLLYYFNFVQIRKMPDIPAELKPAVSKYIAPEALFWFRWAALFTVLAGIGVAALRGSAYAGEVFTFGFATEPNAVGKLIAGIGEARTLGYEKYGASGMLTLFVRAMLCNWMVSTGVIGAMLSTSVPGKVIAMWMPITVFFFMTFEHSVVNMFLFPSGLMLGAKFSIMDYFLWNEIPTVLGNLVGGLAFTGLTLYSTHVRTAPKRPLPASAEGVRRLAA